LNDRIRKNLWVGYLGALVTWSFLTYSLTGEELTGGRLFAFEKDGKPFISDFVNIYNAAVLAKRCGVEPISIYSAQVQAESAAKLTDPVRAEQPFYLQVPPYFFTLVRPLAEVSILQAWFIWSIGSVVALFFALKSLIFPTIEGRFSRAVAVLAVFAAFPEWEGIRSGNTSLWLAPGVILMWCTILRRPVVSAFASTVSLIKIQYLPILALCGMILGKTRFVVTLASSAVILLIASIATVGLDNVFAFPMALLNGERSSQLSGVAPKDMQNLRGELVLLTGSDGTLVHVISLAALFAVLVAVCFLWLRRPQSSANDADFKLRASITTLLLLIASPHTHKHDYVIAIVPAIWLWNLCTTKPEIPSRLRTCIQGAIISFPILSWIFFVLQPLFHLLLIQPYFVWAGTLCGCAFALLAWNKSHDVIPQQDT
jgi:hypothetical protein